MRDVYGPRPRGLVGKALEWLRTTLLPLWPGGDDGFTTTHVFAIVSGEEIFRHDASGRVWVDLTPDGRSLVLHQDDPEGREATMSCYDVPLRRSWVRIAGIPLKFAVLVVTLRFS